MSKDKNITLRIDQSHLVSALIAQCNQSEPNVRAIARILNRNEELAKRVLHESNVIINASRRHITDLPHAVAFLGASRVKAIAAASPTSDRDEREEKGN